MTAPVKITEPMKRWNIIQHLVQNRCHLLGESERHSWWLSPSKHKRTSVPRHPEIADELALKIFQDLDVDAPK